jgi:AhpD family alkylhydroperoxidase
MPVTRVDLIDARRAPLLARTYYEAGDPGPIVGALAHVPEVLEAAMPFLSAMFGDSALPQRTKEMVVLRTSALLQCNYCTQAHSVGARDSGLSREEVLALRGVADLESHFPDEGDQVLLGWVDAVAGGPGPVDEPTSVSFRAHFAEADVVEITLLIAGTMMLNRFCTALELPASASTIERLTEEGLL